MSAQLILIINIGIVSIIQIFLIINYLRRKNTSMFVSNLVKYIVLVLFLLYVYYKELNIPIYVIVCSIIAVLADSFIGYYLNIYNKSRYYDRFAHAFGAFSFSLLGYYILKNFSILAIEIWIQCLFVVLLGISFGVLIEIKEFIHDSFSKKAKDQHGLTDTNFDLIFDVTGSLIAGLFLIL